VKTYLSHRAPRVPAPLVARAPSHALGPLTASLLAALAGCASLRGAPPPVAPSTPVTASVSHAGASAYASDVVASEPAAQPVRAPLRHELVVADAQGLSGHAWDGSSSRVISAGPTLHPRWFGPDKVLALAPKRGSELSGGARIEQISLVDGTRRTLAELPPFSCVPATNPANNAGASDLRSRAEEPSASTPQRLDVQTTSDFQVDADKRVACFDLMDRNTNLATLAMRVRVDLASGQVTRWVTLGAEDCQLPADVLPAVPPEDDVCNGVMQFDAPPPPPTTAEYGFGFEDERVTQSSVGARTEEPRAQSTVGSRAEEPRASTASSKPQVTAALEGYEEEQVSPSGRWLLLGGDPEEGDYMYRRLVLLDRSTGELFPVRAEPGTWPAPLRASGKRKSVRTPVTQAVLLDFEADVRWIGDSAENELLVLHDLLVRPGERSFSVVGELAF